MYPEKKYNTKYLIIDNGLGKSVVIFDASINPAQLALGVRVVSGGKLNCEISRGEVVYFGVESINCQLNASEPPRDIVPGPNGDEAILTAFMRNMMPQPSEIQYRPRY